MTEVFKQTKRRRENMKNTIKKINSTMRELFEDVSAEEHGQRSMTAMSVFSAMGWEPIVPEDNGSCPSCGDTHLNDVCSWGQVYQCIMCNTILFNCEGYQKKYQKKM